jgi:C-terminal processing protease CtpA/Prc
MRAGFGLVAILVTLGVIIVIWSNYTLPVAKQAIQTKKKVEEQFSMNTPEGYADAQASITLTDAMRGTKFDGLTVTAIVPGGAMNKTFGLLPGDQIVAIGGQRLRDPPYDDPEMARATLFEAKLRQQALTVVRNGQEIQLPPK